MPQTRRQPPLVQEDFCRGFPGATGKPVCDRQDGGSALDQPQDFLDQTAVLQVCLTCVRSTGVSPLGLHRCFNDD